MSLNPEIYILKKTCQAKLVRLPLLGKHDCYMEITIQEHHQINCDHQTVQIPDKKLHKAPQEVPKTAAAASEALNANHLIPNNEIDKLNDLLTEIIHSKVKTAAGSGTECSCNSPECSCANSRIAAQESKESAKHSGSNLPKPISSLTTTNKSSASADGKKQWPDAKKNSKGNFKPTFATELQDFPLEGHQQIVDDIDALAKEIYSPEEREKKLRLLRLLIREAIPGTDRIRGAVPIMNKTIEIPNLFGNDLKRTDSLIIRIIVEK